VATTYYLVRDSRMGRLENTSELKAEVTDVKAEVAGVKAEVTGLKAEVAGVKAEVTGVKEEVTGVKAEVTGVKADIAVICDKVEYCQSTVVEGGHHIMKALDGNKKPMRQWLQELEDCKEGSKVDCNPTRKA